MKPWRAGSGLLALLLAAAACFDSDQTFPRAATTSGTSGPGTTTTTTAGTSTTGTSATTETGPFDTCRDAIDCVYMCAATIQAMLNADPDYEPDLSCFIECADTLSTDEVYKLFDLITCASGICKDMGECSAGGSSSGSSTGESSSTSGTDSGSSGSSSSTSTTTTTDAGDDGALLDPCIQCIFIRVQDPESPGCEEFAMACP